MGNRLTDGGRIGAHSFLNQLEFHDQSPGGHYIFIICNFLPWTKQTSLSYKLVSWYQHHLMQA
jgi:hypothetical protein